MIKKEGSEEYKEFKKINDLSKAQEKEFLNSLNEMVIEVSESFNINKTLLLSKKEQKEVLSKILHRGLKLTLDDLLKWKKDLLLKDIYNLACTFNLGG